MTNKELAFYLRCSNSPPGTMRSCTGCQFRYMEEIKPDLPAKPDVVIDGIGYWESCNFTEICEQAAQRLEKTGKHSLLEQGLKDLEENG